MNDEIVYGYCVDCNNTYYGRVCLYCATCGNKLEQRLGHSVITKRKGLLRMVKDWFKGD